MGLRHESVQYLMYFFLDFYPEDFYAHICHISPSLQLLKKTLYIFALRFRTDIASQMSKARVPYILAPWSIQSRQFHLTQLQ